MPAQASTCTYTHHMHMHLRAHVAMRHRRSAGARRNCASSGPWRASQTLYAGPEYAAARIKYANDVLKTCCIEIDAEGKLNGCRAQVRS